MKKLCILAAALGFLLGAAYPVSAFMNEPKSFGDMHWGDSEKKVSERYASRFLEDTVAGGKLYAVRFSDFKEILGVKGPIVVMASFNAKGKLVQINVPMSTDSEEEATQAFKEYTDHVKSLCGAPTREDDSTAYWQGKETSVFVQKRPEGVLVSFADAKSMKS